MEQQEQNKIVGREIAVANAIYIDDGKEKGYVFKGDGLRFLIDPIEAKNMGVTEEAMIDCIDQLEKMGSFDEIKNKNNYGQEGGFHPAGIVITSNIDPKLKCSVEFGSHLNKGPEFADRDDEYNKTDVSLKFFLDYDNESMGAMAPGASPERSVSPEELDLVNKLREKTKLADFSQMQKHENVEVNAALKKLEESVISETGEPDQDYDHELFDAVCKEIKKATGLDCSHKEFDKYQGVYITVKKKGKPVLDLWVRESYVTGKQKKSNAKYRSADLIGPEGDKYSADQGDYHQLPDDYEFEDNDLLLVNMDGSSKSIHNPKKSDLPKSGEVGRTIEFEGKPDDVLVLYPDVDPETEFHVVVSDDKKHVDLNGLDEYLKGKKQMSEGKEKFFNDFNAVDAWGMPIMEDTYKPKYDKVPDSKLHVDSVAGKQKEVDGKEDKKMSDPSKEKMAHVGLETIEKPKSELSGDKEYGQKEMSDKGKIKTGDAEDGVGEHMAEKGNSDDLQNDLAKNKVKVGMDAKSGVGKHMEESAKPIHPGLAKYLAKIEEAKKAKEAKLQESAKKPVAEDRASSMSRQHKELMGMQGKKSDGKKPMKKEAHEAGSEGDGHVGHAGMEKSEAGNKMSEARKKAMEAHKAKLKEHMKSMSEKGMAALKKKK